LLGDQNKENDRGGACSTNGSDGNAYNILVGKPEGKDNLEDLRVDGKVILKWTLRKLGGKMWTGCIWIRMGASGGLL
jgi:hypothetical protein